RAHLLFSVWTPTRRPLYLFVSPRETSGWFFFFSLRSRPPPSSTLFPYTTLFRSDSHEFVQLHLCPPRQAHGRAGPLHARELAGRSEEHTSELQSRRDLVCRLLLEKKKLKRHIELINERTFDQGRKYDIEMVVDKA